MPAPLVRILRRVAEPLEFRVLGPLEIERAGASVRLTGRKHRSLLMLLVLRRGEVVPAEQLADQLWDGAPPASAANAIQVYVSQLRKLLGSPAAIETHPLGYRLQATPESVDLHRFERLWGEGREQLRAGDPAAASARLGEALALWRGEPLPDIAYESFGAAEVRRLQELRLEATIDRIESDLACGRHAQVIGELSALVEQHPLTERLACQLMLALYRCGRQADALDAAAAARRRLDEGYGLAPTSELRDLERAILNQDAGIAAPAAAAPPPVVALAGQRQLMAVALHHGEAAWLGRLAGQLAAGLDGHELVLLRIGGEGTLDQAQSELDAAGEQLRSASVDHRAAAFSSRRVAHDIGRLVGEEPVDLVMTPLDRAATGLDDDVVELLELLPCDVALVSSTDPARDGPVLVPFSGSDHDWAAVGAAAAFARAADAELRLAGTTTAEGDASRLLATASLVTQRAFRVKAVPQLLEAGGAAMLAAAAEAGLVVTGLSGRWREQGIGEARQRLLAGSAPVMLLRAGPRPSAWAPASALTRYTWSAAPGER